MGLACVVRIGALNAEPGTSQRSGVRLRREWKLAREKVEREGRCRHCARSDRKLEAAHVTGRRNDVKAPLRPVDGLGKGMVHPDRVVPLCGPSGDSRSCHSLYDAHRLDLRYVLSAEEWGQAIMDEGSYGLAEARLGGVAVTKKRDYWMDKNYD